ncbi:hypothetical protein D6C91_04377 [Aureobasidium pullulans]|uniref:Myb-like domain-containing protein n=1 Tax=Aureobasidium pullulans TaxID=5580 RepID=A0A4S9TA51_AURPU|nr:hypothetical protein D6C91_04377 [Aureobasidium pullulans]
MQYYGMSDNEADGGSVHHDDNEAFKPQEDSGSEYHSEDDQIDDDDSENEANSIRSGSSKTSARSSNAASLKKSNTKTSVQPQIVKSSKATYSDAYRDYYNDHVEELAHPFLPRTSGLPASEIGITVWTPLEKEILFQKVSTLGKNNIKAVSDAIKTKSESEVRQYLTLLDQGTVEGNVTLALPVFSAADVSPAVEISKQSEDLLEEYADGLARYQLKSDQKREKKRHGDYWLLTDEIAEEIEDEVMARDEWYMNSKIYDEEEDGERELEPEDTVDGQDDLNGHLSDVKTDQDGFEPGINGGQSIAREGAPQTGEPDQEFAEPAEELMVPAAELLDLPMWLRLSLLFMHQPPESGDSWTNFVTSRHETPSMYHTAFQDFHNLTVSLTRRLVQATIFQTMTRLRARDKDQPSTTITVNDVRTAADILELPPNSREFWSGVPRRHGLRVYERGSKFAKGQSRSGAELSMEETEKRMGVGQTSTVNIETDDDVVHTVEDGVEDDILDPDRYYEDPELWTEGSESEDEVPIAIPDDEQSNESGDEAAYDPADSEEAQAAARGKRHRRGRMERNFQKAHDTYLEAMDQEISRIHEVEMWETLGMPAPNEIKNEEIEIPRQPVNKRRLSDIVDWRSGLEYQPPWEHGLEAVQPEEFANMCRRGEQGKKKRRLAYEYLEQKGLITLPPQAPEPIVVRKKANPTDTDVEMEDVPNEEAVIPTTETLDDGVPRKKHPNPILSRVQSRASSMRESSQDSVRSDKSNPRGLSLAGRLLSRAPTQQIESNAKQVDEEERLAAEKLQAEKLAKEEKRKARAARKLMSAEEKQALDEELKEERKRNKRLQRQQEKKQKDEEEKQRIKEEKQKVKEEKKRAKEAKRKSISGKMSVETESTVTPEEEQELSRSPEDGVHEDVISQGVNAEDDEQASIHEESRAESKEPARSTRSRSRKPKRKSGF